MNILTLQISEGYRAARRTVSILCALALAWSAAQFDFQSISLGPVGSLDLSHASIPIILVCAIIYTMTRLILEFAMQSVEVRRWIYAQTDFKLSVFLVQATILILAASGLARSIETVFYVAIGAFAVLVGSRFAIKMVVRLLMPLIIYIRFRQGRKSVAARAIESVFWAQLIVVFIQIFLFVAVGDASLRYESLRSLWTVPPSPFTLWVFVLACCVIVVSMYIRHDWYAKLFARPPIFTEKRLPDGTEQRTYPITPPNIWDWYSQPDDDQTTK